MPIGSKEYWKKLWISRYIDDVLSLNNSRFVDFVDRIYPIELEMKGTTDTARSYSCLDLHLGIDNEGRLRTKLYDKRDYFNSIFSLWTSHLYVATFHQHLHMEYISHLIRYSRACGFDQDFLNRGLLLTRKLPNQGFLLVKLKSYHFESFTVANMTWSTVAEYLCHKWPWICSTGRKHFPVLS